MAYFGPSSASFSVPSCTKGVAHVCVKNGENIGIRGPNMSFEACKSSNFMQSVPFSRFGIAGAVDFEMTYLIDLLPFR